VAPAEPLLGIQVTANCTVVPPPPAAADDASISMPTLDGSVHCGMPACDAMAYSSLRITAGP